MARALLPQWEEESPTRGVQVVYFPNHVLVSGAPLSYEHPYAEFGFITSVDNDDGMAFVRYFYQSRPDELRTKANSEYTPLKNLWPRLSRPQAEINKLLTQLWPT